MPASRWLTEIVPRAGAKTPDGLRVVIGAASGVALSLSFTGLYLSIYSWVCVGALLLSAISARKRVAFACGLLHGLWFGATFSSWFASGVGESGCVANHNAHGYLRFVVSRGGNQCLAGVGSGLAAGWIEEAHDTCRSCSCNFATGDAGWATCGSGGAGAPFCAGGAGQFSRGAGVSDGLVQ